MYRLWLHEYLNLSYVSYKVNKLIKTALLDLYKLHYLISTCDSNYNLPTGGNEQTCNINDPCAENQYLLQMLPFHGGI